MNIDFNKLRKDLEDDRYAASFAGIPEMIMEAWEIESLSDEQRYKLYVKPGHTARQSEDCRKVIRMRGGETTREELCETLWFISEDGVNAGINACPDIIRIGVGRWLLAEHFPIDVEDVQTIGDVIMRELEVKPMVRSNEIKGLLQRELPSMADDLAPYENMALINLLRYYLSDRFSFTATIITARGEKININDQFATFARERDRFTLGELEAVANENGTGIYWETVLQEAVRINQEELVNRSIEIDSDLKGSILEIGGGGEAVIGQMYGNRVTATT